MKITIYEPVLKPTALSKSKDWFTVNGAKSEDRDEAIRLASQHSAVKDGRAEIGRIDTFKVDKEDYYRNPYYW